MRRGAEASHEIRRDLVGDLLAGRDDGDAGRVGGHHLGAHPAGGVSRPDTASDGGEEGVARGS